MEQFVLDWWRTSLIILITDGAVLVNSKSFDKGNFDNLRALDKVNIGGTKGGDEKRLVLDVQGGVDIQDGFMYNWKKSFC